MISYFCKDDINYSGSTIDCNFELNLKLIFICTVDVPHRSHAQSARFEIKISFLLIVRNYMLMACKPMEKISIYQKTEKSFYINLALVLSSLS